MAQIRRTAFVTALSDNVRRRHVHNRIGNRVTSFTVQIEVFLHARWMPVVRFDTGHGFAHRDLIFSSGRVDKTPLFMQNFNEALDYAESDLRSNWQSYVENFSKEIER